MDVAVLPGASRSDVPTLSGPCVSASSPSHVAGQPPGHGYQGRTGGTRGCPMLASPAACLLPTPTPRTFDFALPTLVRFFLLHAAVRNVANSPSSCLPSVSSHCTLHPCSGWNQQCPLEPPYLLLYPTQHGCRTSMTQLLKAMLIATRPALCVKLRF